MTVAGRNLNFWQLRSCNIQIFVDHGTAVWLALLAILNRDLLAGKQSVSTDWWNRRASIGTKTANSGLIYLNRIRSHCQTGLLRTLCSPRQQSSRRVVYLFWAGVRTELTDVLCRGWARKEGLRQGFRDGIGCQKLTCKNFIKVRSLEWVFAENACDQLSCRICDRDMFWEAVAILLNSLVRCFNISCFERWLTDDQRVDNDT